MTTKRFCNKCDKDLESDYAASDIADKTSLRPATITTSLELCSECNAEYEVEMTRFTNETRLRISELQAKYKMIAKANLEYTEGRAGSPSVKENKWRWITTNQTLTPPPARDSWEEQDRWLPAIKPATPFYTPTTAT